MGFQLVPYVFFKKADEEIFKQPDGWKAFYDKYPGSVGYVSLSRVGFSMEMNQAVVYVAHWCGGLCGKGKLVLLQKQNGVWKITKEMLLWIL
jgi:hypothetical protein